MQLFAVFLPGESIFVPQAQQRIITTVSLTLMYVRHNVLFGFLLTGNFCISRTNIYGTGAHHNVVMTLFDS